MGSSGTGAGRVTVHAHGHDRTLGTAYSEHGLVVFVENAGIHDPDTGLDAPPRRIEWRGGRAHPWNVG
ncbi:hypothetical protein [Streptomyces sp. NPDC048295]|uniref:hypothetical protein n=1 Tax=Streptomyces sp. NPDC048295 TaxID=3154617 RepID=UPI00343BEBD0